MDSVINDEKETDEVLKEESLHQSENQTEITEESNEMSFTEDTGDEDEKQKRKMPWKKIITIGIIILLVVSGVFYFVNKRKAALENSSTEIKVMVERKDIKNTVSGSSVMQAKDSYNVTAMVTGEITSDTFNEGDQVKKNDILYQIDSETVQQSVDTAQNSLVKAQNSLVKAQQSYNDALNSKSLNSENNSGSIETAKNALKKAQMSYADSADSFSDLSVISPVSGTVSEVFVKEGDNVVSGGKIATVYSDKYMKLQVPFLEDDAESISVGSGATVTIVGTGDEVWGSVTAVSSASMPTESHAIVKYVTIELENPGALTINDKATAVVGSVASNNVGTFEYINDVTITAKTSGEIKSLAITAKDGVYSGQVIATLESDTMETSLDNAIIAVEDAQISLEKTVRSAENTTDDSTVLSAQLALDDAKLSLEDSKISLAKAKKNLEDYTIKAPIDGTVVTKNKKAGDNLENSSASSSGTGANAMAVIYDLSSLKLQLNVDETEVMQVSVGQSVSITADALEGQEFMGTVQKVGIDGTSANGVTTYPIEVVVTEYGDLLPGMNVTAEIVVEEVTDVLAIPVSSLQRGNVVYIKGEKEDENDKAPAGYKSVKVQTGINDEDYIQIVSGLAEGQELKGQEIQQDDAMAMMMQGGMGGDMDMGGGAPQGGGGAPPAGGGGNSGGGPR